MSHETPVRPLTTAYAEAAVTAGHAPSVHNTQPWQWRVLPDALELRIATQRRLAATDPEGRLLVLSCGAALHHARLALAAEGWTPQVQRYPDPADPQLLARVVSTHHGQPDPEAKRLVQCVPHRHTDRRPVSEQPVPATAIDEIVRAAGQGGGRMQIISADQVLELAAAASHAEAAEADDPRIREELAYWTSRADQGLGLSAEVLPEQAPQTTVPGRDFGRPGTLPIGAGHDRTAVYALLYGDDDEPDSWLRAGEALSAAWLTATRLGVSVVPLSAVVEVAGTRQTLRQLIAGLGYPYLVLRLGIADPTQPGPPHTPRLPATQVVDTSAVDGQPPTGGA